MDELRRWRAEQAARYLEDVRGKMLRVKSLTRAIDEQRGIAEGLQGIDYSRDLVKDLADRRDPSERRLQVATATSGEGGRAQRVRPGHRLRLQGH